ncbi:MAG: SRPBCC family protein [Myxococcaceae bacterium]
MHRLALVAALVALACRAERPQARAHAPAEFFQEPKSAEDTPGARFVASLPDAVRKALARDSQVVLDQKSNADGPALIRAVVRFNRPKAEVWELISRVSEQHQFLPHVTQSKTFGERTAEGEANDYVVSFLFTFKYRTQHWFYAEEARVEWALDPAGEDSLEAQEGFWQLYELDEKTTIAEYGTRLVVRGAFINFLRSLGERGGVRDSLTAFRTHIEQAKL